MARQIVNADGVSAPQDGTIFNAKCGDSVIRVRWSDDQKKDWEGADSNRQWRRLDYYWSAPETWWPEAKAHGG